MNTNADGERGSALLGVMLFSSLAALVIAMLVGRVVVEHQAVEDSIAQTRAYWAATGFNNYVLSRTATSGSCKPSCNALMMDYSPVAKGYLSEIADMQDWYYPDVSASYFLQLHSQVCQDAYAPLLAKAEVVIKTAFSGNSGPGPAMPPCPTAPLIGIMSTCPAPKPSDPNTLDALRSLASARPVEFRYCIVAAGTTTCGGGASSGTLGTKQLITSVHRPAC